MKYLALLLAIGLGDPCAAIAKPSHHSALLPPPLAAAPVTSPAEEQKNKIDTGIILGRLAVVAVPQADIFRQHDPASRRLSTVGEGTYIAVLDQKGDYTGVLMIDRTTGWIRTANIRLIRSQVAVADMDKVTSASPKTVPMDAKTTAILQEAFSYQQPRARRSSLVMGLDSSAFVQQVFATQGVKLPRRVHGQARAGAPVAWEDLRAGDRLFFDSGNRGRAAYTGIYLGNGYFIYASHKTKRVRVDSLMKPHFYNGLLGARRL